MAHLFTCNFVHALVAKLPECAATCLLLFLNAIVYHKVAVLSDNILIIIALPKVIFFFSVIICII